MCSASDGKTDAWRAEADAFLRKPEDISSLAATVTRLLTKGSE
jgi:DNA-binding response OmpR family regulator